jgi:hypothetical protein
MIVMVRDTWRAVLVVVVAVLLRDVFAERPAAVAPAPPAVATQWQAQAWQPAPAPSVATQNPDRPLRRVAQAVVELGDSVIGVVRR